MLNEKITGDFKKYEATASRDKQFAARANAFEAFSRLGFPTTANEEWKYTNLKNLLEKDYQVGAEGSGIAGFVQGLYIHSLVCNRLVFVNGIFSGELSSVMEKNGSIIISGLQEAREQHAQLVEKHFGKYAAVETEGLNAMNTAMLNDGAFIYVPAKQVPQFPVLIIHIADSTSANALVQPRNLIVLEENAALQVIEAYYANGANASFTNAVNEVYVGENATIDHYKVQQQSGETYHNNYTQVYQEASSRINHVTLTLDGTLVRNNLHFLMNGENCNALLYGLYIAEKKNHVDNHTRVDHARPNCFSNELYKGVLKDKATAVFNGKIIVHEDAQKTNAYQRNQNILLSDEATVNTKPQLEIFADDVKCTHGATVGQLDEEPMFYLRSRGIPEAEARSMLLNAFADAIAEEIRIEELIQLVEAEISKKL